MTNTATISPTTVAIASQTQAWKIDTTMVRLGKQFKGDADLAVLNRILEKVVDDGPDQEPSDVLIRATQVLALLERAQATLNSACKSLQAEIAVADTLQQVGKWPHLVQNPPTNV